MLLYDQHTHSRHSHESNTVSTVEALCRAGDAGLSGIAVTDHYDIRRRPCAVVTEQLRASGKEVLRTRAQLDGRFFLGLGIELGEGHHDPGEAAAALELALYDLVLGSLHNLRDLRDFYYIGRDCHDKRELFRDCGGELVTVGSDAHDASRVGGGISDGAELLKAAGFRYQAGYHDRKPNIIPV